MIFIRPTSGIDGQKTLLERIDIEQYMVHIQCTFRLLLLALFCFFVLGLFRIDIAIGRIFTAGMLTVTLTIILIYLAWQFFTGWVDKKIREEMPKDEELEPKLIGKLKSQRVRQMEDSAMIMRIKFTTPPGEQFVMRKEILGRLQEAFRNNNIEFAHRNVTVYMPSEDETSTGQGGGKTVAQPVVQGAASAALLAEKENEREEDDSP